MCNHRFYPHSGYSQKHGRTEMLACNDCPAVKIIQRIDFVEGKGYTYPNEPTYETILEPWNNPLPIVNSYCLGIK